MKTENYNDTFSVYYMWQVIATLALVSTGLVFGGIAAAFGAADNQVVFNMSVAASILMWAWAMIIGMIKMARSWPTGEVHGFWTGVKVVFLNFALLGYRHLAIKDLPWKAVFTWGLAAILFSPSMVEPALSGNWNQVVVLVIVSFIILPVIVSIMWGIGKCFGLVFNR